VTTVLIGANARRQLRRVPQHVLGKLLYWVSVIEQEGLSEAGKMRGFHDEALKGKLKGLRSIRLNRAYRALYRVGIQGGRKTVHIEGITKHVYH